MKSKNCKYSTLFYKKNEIPRFSPKSPEYLADFVLYKEQLFLYNQMWRSL